jgi:hypothetical protein
MSGRTFHRQSSLQENEQIQQRGKDRERYSREGRRYEGTCPLLSLLISPILDEGSNSRITSLQSTIINHQPQSSTITPQSSVITPNYPVKTHTNPTQYSTSHVTYSITIVGSSDRALQINTPPIVLFLLSQTGLFTRHHDGH